MQQYTVRYAHLESPSSLIEGDLVLGRDVIGKMGNTGSSNGAHLHIDVLEGLVKKVVRLSEIGYENGDLYTPNIKQLNYFIDDYLFDTHILITTPFYDPTYEVAYEVSHPAYDVVPENRKTYPGRNNIIYWNRSKTGLVVKTGYDNGYGNYVLILFEA